MPQHNDFYTVYNNLPYQDKQIIHEVANGLLTETKYDVILCNPIFNEQIARNFAKRLQINHILTGQLLSKKPFEYAFCNAWKANNGNAFVHQNSVSAGADISVNNHEVSCKTTSAQTQSKSSLSISKMMEGRWIRDCETGEDFCIKVKQKFKEHLNHYDFILYLKGYKENAETATYDLLEIPKKLLLKATEIKPKDWKIENNSNGVRKNVTARVLNKNKHAFTLTLDTSVEKVSINSLKISECNLLCKFTVDDLI